MIDMFRLCFDKIDDGGKRFNNILGNLFFIDITIELQRYEQIPWLIVMFIGLNDYGDFSLF